MSVRSRLIRPDDLLHLMVEAVNMRLDLNDPSAPALVVEEPEREAYLVIGFPPQAVVEEAVFEQRMPPINAPEPSASFKGYQPYALPESKISRVVTADFAQLTPSRAAIVTADPYHPGRLRVTVTGVAPTGPALELVGVEPPTPVTRPTQVEVVVQERRDDLSASDAGELAWVDVDGLVATVADRMSSVGSPPPLLLWTGTVDFAAAPAPGRYRLLVCEYEYYAANHLLVELDGRTGDPRTVAPRRLVYAETVDVDAALLSGPPAAHGTTV